MIHKKHISEITVCVATMLLCVLLASCGNEEIGGGDPWGPCNDICFGISANRNTRAVGATGGEGLGQTTDRFTLRSADSADTLCVRTIVTDSISSGMDGERAITRGTPVTGQSNFHDNIHVLAYWRKGGTTVDDSFYMNEDAKNNGGAIWSTNRTYYWPGADHAFRFYAWAPAGVASLAAPSSPRSKRLTYTVPANVINQNDIMVATPEEAGTWVSGDNNAPVPLSFRHVCTAVRFAVGNQMQPGTIKSVALKGVRGSGSYDMDNATWTLGEATTDFTQAFSKVTTGYENNGDLITPTEGTFMMLPQTLPAGAMLEVVFANTAGIERTLTASIGNSVWTMGKTVTYKLSISPEYDINIDVPAEAQDAHYITFPITVNVKDYNGAWTLSSNLPNDVFFTRTKTALQEQGYWIDDDKGTSSISGSGSGSFTYYVYVTENIGDDARDLQFRVTPQVGGAGVYTANVRQLCPSWNAQGVGYERIEENNGGNYPFGFKWDRKVVFTAEPRWSGSSFNAIMRNLFGAYVFRDIAKSAKDEHQADYITIEETRQRILFWDFTTKTTVTINYAQISSLEGQTNESNGLQNTRNLYFHQGIGDIVDVENQLRNNAVGTFTETVTGGGQTTVENFAVRMAVMKNKFTKKQIVIEQGGEQITVWIPEIKKNDIVWYLPAINEQVALSDTDRPLSGNYWSSTATSDNINAYMYGHDTASQQDDRMNTYKIRAARARQQ